MNIDELLLNIHNISFDSLISQSAILSEEDRQKYRDRGYNILLTSDEFKKRFEIDPSRIWYTPSISQDTLYFNEESLAAAPFHMQLYLMPSFGELTDVKQAYKVIQMIEESVSQGDYQHSLFALPEGLRMEYLNKLIAQKDRDIFGLYNLFIDNYVTTDYGFQKIDPNALKEIIRSKTETDKRKTAKKLKNLPNRLTVYRGGNTASTPFKKAYSWTLDMNVANFFAVRHGTGEGYIAQGEVYKKDIIEALLDERGESEILIDPTKVHRIKTIAIHGIDYLAPLLPKIANIYHSFMQDLADLEFVQESSVHGEAHEARVLLLSQIIAHQMNLSSEDKEILAEAAIYHDTQRTNDGVDAAHGEASAEYYQEVVAYPDPLVSFICKFHCLDDAEGYNAIEKHEILSKTPERAKLLLDIFKDADALDRVRFGIRDLDINQLRLPISKELTLVARLIHENVKIPPRQQSLSDKIEKASRQTVTTSASQTIEKHELTK